MASVRCGELCHGSTVGGRSTVGGFSSSLGNNSCPSAGGGTSSSTSLGRWTLAASLHRPLSSSHWHWRRQEVQLRGVSQVSQLGSAHGLREEGRRGGRGPAGERGSARGSLVGHPMSCRDGSAVERAACLAAERQGGTLPLSACSQSLLHQIAGLPAHAVDHRVGWCRDARVGDGLAGGAAAVTHLVRLAARDGGCAAWLDGHQGGSN